ncbi:MAG: Mur ligase family protein [Bacteriovoracaceae bacterium]|nr:Mur ligase family protein [Bacteriovoracaceae bacterium]
MSVFQTQEDKLLTWLATEIGFENYGKAIERSIDRIRFFFDTFQKSITEKKIKIITVAGTNGKGETCHWLAHYLKRQGISYTLWTSPHILSICERFDSEEGRISLDELEERCFKLKARLDQWNLKLSYFEFLFWIFLDFSLARPCEVIILEVGMGGRLDATNLLDCDVAAIVSIGRDHQEFLGNRYDQILKEKYGIVRANKKQTLITCLELDYLKQLIAQWTMRDQIVWRDIFKKNSQESFSKSNQNLSQEILSTLFPEKKLLTDSEPMAAPFIARGEAMRYKNLNFLFYGSHNLDGTRKLIASFSSLSNKDLPSQDIILSFSKRSLDDISHMLLAWIYWQKRNPSAKIYLTQFNHLKAADTLSFFNDQEIFKRYPKIKDAFEQNKIQPLPDWKTIFLSSQNSTSFLVTGSYYFVGAFQRYLMSLS